MSRMKFTVTLEDGTVISSHDIAVSIKREGRDAECGMRQIEFVIQRVLDQRATDAEPKRLA